MQRRWCDNGLTIGKDEVITVARVDVIYLLMSKGCDDLTTAKGDPRFSLLLKEETGCHHGCQTRRCDILTPPRGDVIEL